MHQRETPRLTEIEGVELPKADQCFAQSLGVRGGNVVEVALEDGSTTLCMIPSKFNKKVWIKVGGTLIIDRPVPLDGDAKITSNVISVLSSKDLKILNKSGIVPWGTRQREQPDKVQDAGSHSSDDIPPNPNHRHAVQYDVSETDSD